MPVSSQQLPVIFRPMLMNSRWCCSTADGVPYGIDMCSQVTVMDVVRDGVPAGACFAPNVSCKAAQFAGGQPNFGGREQVRPPPFPRAQPTTNSAPKTATRREKYTTSNPSRGRAAVA